MDRPEGGTNWGGARLKQTKQLEQSLALVDPDPDHFPWDALFVV